MAATAGNSRRRPGAAGLLPAFALALLLGGVGGDAPARPAEPLDRAGYVLTFHDEFDHFDRRSAANPNGVWDTRFVRFNVRRLSSNHEQQVYIDPEYAGSAPRPLGIDPFHVRDGVLAIEARPADREAVLPYVKDVAYTSGMVSSERSFAQQYGYFEIRCRMPAGKGLWPAFWMLAQEGGWPPEIDVFEMLGAEPGRIFMTSHHPTVRQGSAVITPDATAWHTYGVEWTPDKLTWTIDDVAVFSQPNRIHKPMYVIANLAVGGAGSWGGAPAAATPFPARLEIDYIRIYARRDAIPAGAAAER